MNKKRQSGLTLVELLIGMVVGMIVLAGAISVFSNSVKSQADNVQLTRLNQDLRAMMDIMVRDIRRAGFVTSSPDTNFASLQNNPFVSATTDLAIYNSGSCIVYSYNRDNDSPPVVDDNERLGFRLGGNGNKFLQMRQTGTTNANCTNRRWQKINDSKANGDVAVIEITNVLFTLTSSALDVSSMMDASGDGNANGLCDVGEACNTCTLNGAPDPACLYVRNVTISLTGRLVNDTAVTQTITEEIRIRNDKFVRAVP